MFLSVFAANSEKDLFKVVETINNNAIAKNYNLSLCYLVKEFAKNNLLKKVKENTVQNDKKL